MYLIVGLYRIKADSISSKELLDSNKNLSGVDDPRIHLIRVRNPWGDKNEWRGKNRYNKNIVSIFISGVTLYLRYLLL